MSWHRSRMGTGICTRTEANGRQEGHGTTAIYLFIAIPVLQQSSICETQSANSSKHRNNKNNSDSYCEVQCGLNSRVTTTMQVDWTTHWQGRPNKHSNTPTTRCEEGTTLLPTTTVLVPLLLLLLLLSI